MKAKVTPWDVKGKIDYERLIKEFGTEEINDKILEIIKKSFGELHPLLKERIFYSHRDIKSWIDAYNKKENIALYTGRGPSEHTHLGHIVPWILTRWIQERTGAELYFQFTDDEKFLFKENISLEKIKKFAYENMLDVAALGFQKKKTFFILDTHHAGLLYPLAIRVAKKITFSTVKSVFGFTNSNNIGEIFYTSMQTVPIMLPKALTGKDYKILIPMGIDQDPHFRVARDVLEKLGFNKPSCLHSKFFPSLKGDMKMSASDPDSTIYLIDDAKTVERKIKKKALTGGRETAKAQREKGGNPEICPIFMYYKTLFPEKIEERYHNCKTGKILCGECKQELIDKLNKFLEKHQEKREKLRDSINEWLLSESHSPISKK